jgi:hypothetical protein
MHALSMKLGAGPPFLPSLFVLAAVVMRKQRPWRPTDRRHQILGLADGAIYRFAGDEHGILAFPPGGTRPSLGQRVLLGASHCDPTVNLYACYHVGERPEMQIWPIAACHGRPPDRSRKYRLNSGSRAERLHDPWANYLHAV